MTSSIDAFYLPREEVASLEEEVDLTHGVSFTADDHIKMVQEVHVEGYDAYNKAVEENKGKQVFAMFCGSKDANGASWCPDCVTGKP